MNKTELIAAMAAKTGFTKKDLAVVVDAFTDVVSDALTKGDKVSLVGFGSFEVVERAARVGRDPQTGKPMNIPASKAPKFKAGSNLKAIVKGE